MDKIKKIKEWISKKQDGLMDANGNFRTAADEASYNTLCNLDAYIDSLQEEPASGKQVKESLISKHDDKTCKENGNSLTQEPVSDELDKAAREDAKVVRSDDTEVGYNLDRYSGFISGAEWRLAQMMKKAVDGHATFEFYGIEGKAYGTIAHDPISFDDLGLKDTDKCKLIIIKED